MRFHLYPDKRRGESIKPTGEVNRHLSTIFGPRRISNGPVWIRRRLTAN